VSECAWAPQTALGVNGLLAATCPAHSGCFQAAPDQPATYCAVVVASGDEIYREWGWNMFRAFERWTRRDTGGYATVTNVNSVS
jgi:hypothetical protein